MPIELDQTYLHLSPDTATAIPGGDAFWNQVMSGAPSDPRIVAMLEGGWLVSRFVHDGDWPHWERHPQGDEVLTALKGAMAFQLETDGGVERIDLQQGQTLVVPAGVWHRGVGDGPCTVLAVTAGKGTQHRSH